MAKVTLIIYGVIWLALAWVLGKASIKDKLDLRYRVYDRAVAPLRFWLLSLVVMFLFVIDGMLMVMTTFVVFWPMSHIAK